MIATIQQLEQGYVACNKRQIKHSVQDVWAMLTDNTKLEKWFQELRVGELREGGFMQFDMSNGKFEQLEILAYAVHSVLEFDWFGDIVRFELQSEQEGCLLIFVENFSVITDQTIKDLAGWHVCLNVIESLLDDKPIDSRKEEWKKWHEKYEQAMQPLKVAD
ncbi:SRPBCC family protein [Sporosarcina sp. YIM B06819]|uniref:SRPBCC family protein n=1 Tax=Sporosarcina sp. YIM B06819 TaxID=3081769 RepID=UPI00298C8932|nr:SRPBCC family protein [Sporosarcina sp. YIM B06819]